MGLKAAEFSLWHMQVSSNYRLLARELPGVDVDTVVSERPAVSIQISLQAVTNKPFIWRENVHMSLCVVADMLNQVFYDRRP